MNFLGLGTDAIVLRTTAQKEMQLAVSKTWTFTPGAPFVGSANVCDMFLQIEAMQMHLAF